MMVNRQTPQEASREDDDRSDLFEIDLFGLAKAILKRWKLCAGIVGGVTFLGLLYCFMATPVYLASCRMLVEPGSLKVTTIDEVYDSEFGRDSGSRRDFINTQMKLMTSDHILARIYEHFDFAKKSDFLNAREPLAKLADRIEVKQVPNTSLVDIGFKDPDARFSAEVSNFLANTYIDDSRQRSTGFSERGLEKLQDELVNMERERFAAIDKLNNFKKLHDMLSVQTENDLLVARLTALDAALVDAKQGVANAQAAVAAIDEWKRQGLRLDSIPEAIQNPTLTNFKVVRLQAQATLVKSLQDFGPSHRSVQTQRQVIAKMDQAIEDETENSLISIRAKAEEANVRLTLVEKEIAEATEKLKGLDQIADAYRVLEDNLKAKEKSYQYVLGRVGELQIAKSADAGSGGTFQVIVPATPPQRAAYPQKAKTMLILILASGVLSVLICLVMELLDKTVKTREEMENCAKLPIFGEIPFAHKTERVDFIGYDEPKGPVAEAFRALRTSLSLSPASSKSKLIAVTSSVPSEGKSFVTLNLALTYARGGKRVLLIDCDMRRRRLTHLLMGEKSEAAGLSNLLATTVTEPLSALTVKPFSDMNLSFLPAGPTPPNPVELLGSETAPAFFTGLEAQYDLVVVDTAPVLLVSDTLNLSAVKSLRYLVVGQCFKTEKKQLQETCDALRRVNAEVVGTVLQLGAKAGEEAGYGSDYGYGYKYGYGYGADRAAPVKTPWYRRLGQKKA